MKHFYNFKIAIIILIVLLVGLKVWAQPVGASISNPIDAGTLIPGVTFSDTKNNSPSNGYINNIGQASDDIYYRFTLASNAEVNISHCASGFDTYMYLLNASGSIIASNDDLGPLCSGLQASIKISLAAGAYYVVSEGYYTNSGAITTTLNIPAASTEVINVFAQQVGQVFSSLETSRVPFGLLRDVAMEQTNLDNYNGTVLVDSNFVSNAEWHAIYQTLVSASIGNNAPDFPEMKLIDSLCFNERGPGKIILNGLFYKYSRFTDNAVQNNQIMVSGGKVYDKYISGVWQNPYQTETAFAISPAAYNFRGTSQQIILPAFLWQTNDAVSISSIQVDAGDGLGYRNINFGQTLNVSYPDTGLKVISYKLNLVNNTVLYSHSQIHIAPSINTNIPDVVTYPVTATEIFEGRYAKGFISIKYSNATLGLRKPLIVAEGFDVGKILYPESLLGDVDIVEFLRLIQDGNLANILKDNPQYDIVYVDWEDGTDNIKRNAKLLKEVIRQVNVLKAQAGSTEKNIVLGQSMGGLVARWALKEMENNQEDHQVKLYISHDSPHQGANVPLGFQYLGRHITGLYLKTAAAPYIEAFNFLTGGSSPLNKLGLPDRPASRQMLINYVDKNYNIDNSVHNQWQTELKNMGYPQGFPGSPLKLISISNGSQCANGQEFEAGAELLKYEGSGNTRFLGDLAGMLAAPLANSLTGQPALLLGVLPGKNKILFDFNIHATGQGGGNNVYHGNITYKKTILWLIPISITITNKDFNAPASMLPYDSYPGGFYNVPVNLSDTSNKTAFIKYNINASNRKTFNFIPVTSALDVGLGNTTLVEGDYLMKYVANNPPAAPKNIPFQNFTTGYNNSTLNEIHISFNSNNGDWLAQELQNNNAQPVDCTFQCSTPIITGSANVCNSSETYYIDNLSIGATVTWFATGNTTFAGGINTGSNITINNSAHEYITLTAVINTGCGDFLVTKDITVGIPEFYSTIDTYWDGPGSYVVGINTPVIATITTPYPNAIYYNWEIFPYPDENTYIQNGWPIPSGTVSAGGNNAVFDFDVPGDYMITVKAQTACGETNPIYVFYLAVDTSTYEGAYRVYPNPANSELTISYENMQKHQESVLKSPKSKTFYVKLFNDKGAVIRTLQSETDKNNLKLDTRDIPSGNYYLHIYHEDSKKVIKKQIIIRH